MNWAAPTHKRLLRGERISHQRGICTSRLVHLSLFFALVYTNTQWRATCIDKDALVPHLIIIPSKKSDGKSIAILPFSLDSFHGPIYLPPIGKKKNKKKNNNCLPSLTSQGFSAHRRSSWRRSGFAVFVYRNRRRVYRRWRKSSAGRRRKRGV